MDRSGLDERSVVIKLTIPAFCKADQIDEYCQDVMRCVKLSVHGQAVGEWWDWDMPDPLNTRDKWQPIIVRDRFGDRVGSA